MRKIAIVGAGIGGLAAAAFLHRDGHEVTIYEKFPVPHPVGAGLLLQPTGLAILAALGLDQEAVARSSPIRYLHGEVARKKRVIFDLSYGDLGPHLFGLGIHRGTLFSLLYDLVAKLGVPIHTGKTIASLHYDAQNLPLLRDAQDNAYGPFDLVIDAHGMNSGLRAQHAEIRLNRKYPYGALWGIARDVDGKFAADTLAQRYHHASHMIGVLPVGCHNGDDCRSVAFFWSLRSDGYEAWKTRGIAEWRRQVIDLWPETEDLVMQFATPESLTFATYSDTILRRPYRDRLAFIGDAAHCTSPQLGQGANLALVDAYSLAASLRTADTIAAALVLYARARKDHVRFYQTASRWLTPFFQSDSRLLPLVRDWTFGPLCRVPFMKHQMLQTLAGVKTGVFSHLDPGQWDADYSIKAD